MNGEATRTWTAAIMIRDRASLIVPHWYYTQPKKLGTRSIAPALMDIARVSINAASSGLLEETK